MVAFPHLFLMPPGALAASLAKAGQSMLRTVAPEHHKGGGSRAPSVFLAQHGNGAVTLSAAPMNAARDCVWHAGPMPLENARFCPVGLGTKVPSVHEYARFGVVVLLVDGSGSVLLTRRAKHMRTFPRAWVCPGGGVDPGELPADAASRELREETGIEVHPSSLRPLCLWESVYPTTPEACLAAGCVKGHYLVLFFVARLARLSRRPDIKLQQDETDAALWLPPEHLWAFSLEGASRRHDGTIVESADVRLSVACGDGIDEESVGLPVVAQCYPSEDGKLNGCGEAHMFALRELARVFTVRELAGDFRDEAPLAAPLTARL